MIQPSPKRVDLPFKTRFLHPRHWGTWLLLGVFKLVALMPMRWSFGLGALLGKLFYCFAATRRKIARVNVALCFPALSDAEQDVLVRKILHSVAVGFIETTICLWGQKDKIQGRYVVTGLDILEKIAAKGQGILLVGAHYTTIEIAGLVMGWHFPCDMVYRRDDKNEVLAYAMARAREAYSGECIARDNTRHLVKNLRRGRCVWYAPDQDFGAQDIVFAPFFGVQTATLTATSRLAKIGRAQVVPFVHYRDADGIYHVEIKPPLDNFPSGDDVLDATRINAGIEAAVRRYPEQYLWVHRRFKTRPEGEPPLYAPRQKR